MSNPGPLPHHTRLQHKETLESFSLRHAFNNGYTRAALERTLLKHPTFIIEGRNRVEQQKTLWRQLGGLDSRAFDGSEAGHEDITRGMCLKCTSGDLVRVRRSELGWVCLFHRRWFGGPHQVQVENLEEVLIAEKLWRRKVVPPRCHRGVENLSVCRGVRTIWHLAFGGRPTSHPHRPSGCPCAEHPSRVSLSSRISRDSQAH